MYPVVFFDALRVKLREDAVVRNKAIYLALGVLPDGTRDLPTASVVRRKRRPPSWTSLNALRTQNC